MSKRNIYSSRLDKGIENAVRVLSIANVETFESCEGGEGHAYPEPTVRFHGNRAEGFRALSVAMQAGLKVASLRRTWPINEDEPTGPWWEMVFVPHQRPNGKGSYLPSRSKRAQCSQSGLPSVPAAR